MRLNTLKPAVGSKSAPKRVGRGIGSGLGKTCGRGHKGQKARSGGFHKVGFEGGQMPLQRRLPKFGFTSRKSLVSKELRLDQLNLIENKVIDLDALRAAGLINHTIKFVKVMLAGEIKKTVKLKGIRVSKGARAEIEKAGGSIED